MKPQTTRETASPSPAPRHTLDRFALDCFALSVATQAHRPVVVAMFDVYSGTLVDLSLDQVAVLGEG